VKILRFVSFLGVGVLVTGCAALAGVAGIRPPIFEVAPERQSELRILGPALDRPLGGASVRLWARVTNPNAFGITLAAIDGTFSLEDQRAADVDFPLGLPLAAAADTIIPIDIRVSLADVPRLAELLFRGVERSELDYSLDGRVRVDGGVLGQPVFGPMPLLSGTVQVHR
jgi:hypothetical protein